MGYCVCPVTLNWTLLCKFIKWCKFSSHIKVTLRNKKLCKNRPAFIQVCIKWCTNIMFSPKCVNLNCCSHDTSMSASFLLHLHGWEVMPQFMLLAAYYREIILMSKNVLFHSCLDLILFFVPFRLKWPVCWCLLCGRTDCMKNICIFFSNSEQNMKVQGIQITWHVVKYCSSKGGRYASCCNRQNCR